MNAPKLELEELTPAQIMARKRSAAALDLARLRASTARLTRSNDLYARRMSVRFARWESLGCFQPVPGAKP